MCASTVFRAIARRSPVRLVRSTLRHQGQDCALPLRQVVERDARTSSYMNDTDSSSTATNCFHPANGSRSEPRGPSRLRTGTGRTGGSRCSTRADPRSRAHGPRRGLAKPECRRARRMRSASCGCSCAPLGSLVGISSLLRFAGLVSGGFDRLVQRGATARSRRRATRRWTPASGMTAASSSSFARSMPEPERYFWRCASRK